ncbi:MAG: membrane protein [marine bacterium B5-7]|nr:MAG: membrane protein [marine bacterium B5-7]
MKPGDVFWALTAALIWGATFPISAIALETTPPIFFAFLRFLVAAAFIVIVPRPSVSWIKLIAIGLFLGAGQYGFMFVSMTRGISAGLASLLVHTQAFFTIIIAMIVFSERLAPRQFVALMFAFAGLACLVINRSQAGAMSGLLLVLIAAICGAAGNNILKSLKGVNMLGVAVWMSMVVPIPLLILSAFIEGNGSPWSLMATVGWPTIGALAYSAILATVVVFTIWGRLLTTYSAATVAPFFLLVPVFGISLSAMILGETFNGLQMLGGGLIFTGLVLALWPRKTMRIG